MAKGFLDTQIQNRNFLSATGFRFILNRAPKVSFFSNSVNIPSINLGVANQPTYLKDIPLPGDKLEFEDFTVRFLVDENLENYMEIQNWMRGLGYPESLSEIYDLQKEKSNTVNGEKSMNIYSDGSLIALNSTNNIIFKVNFRDMFPVYLSSLQFDATDTNGEYFTSEVTFKYTLYKIVDRNDKEL